MFEKQSCGQWELEMQLPPRGLLCNGQHQATPQRELELHLCSHVDGRAQALGSPSAAFPAAPAGIRLESGATRTCNSTLIHKSSITSSTPTLCNAMPASAQDFQSLL